MDIINNKLSMLKSINKQQQQQQQLLRGNPSRICTFCKKREPWNAQPGQKLKRCSRCRARLYCSRACQRSDWKKGHQMACAATTTTTTANKSKDENRTETETERNEKENSYLESLSEEEAMNQLIDAYRLRVEDERIYRGYLRGRYAPQNTDTDTIITTNTDASLQSALRDFQDFLDLAETSPSPSSPSPPPPSSSSSSPSSSTASASSPSSSSESKTQLDETEQSRKNETKSSVLPSWWTPQKRADCEWRALQSGFWSSLCAPVEKDAIVERYRDSMMPMKLRVLAEAVYGYNVMDQPR
ncbi:uncharacterized protein TRUGW13939_03451 [Talaromyces rugulosus]|uniref:MYND-type domain-containing protein n=1 Tax=Talaromyces rugulosus TaxID=121627 RepID=A0A7H8QQV9_TALRU|nr:uncharacterized protein TRUGW13939_03451 [Talaromyces rugulosus]QKX56350.1 hypothetical protein TRUGW13939_03451 [Talaromyces rugulosus]